MWLMTSFHLGRITWLLHLVKGINQLGESESKMILTLRATPTVSSIITGIAQKVNIVIKTADWNLEYSWLAQFCEKLPLKRRSCVYICSISHQKISLWCTGQASRHVERMWTAMLINVMDGPFVSTAGQSMLTRCSRLSFSSSIDLSEKVQIKTAKQK